jgi:hypothetical protein
MALIAVRSPNDPERCIDEYGDGNGSERVLKSKNAEAMK